MAKSDTDQAVEESKAAQLKEATQASREEAIASGNGSGSEPAQIDTTAYREEIAGALGLPVDHPQVASSALGAYLKDQARQAQATPPTAPATPTEPAAVIELTDEQVALNQRIIDDALAHGRKVIDYEKTIGDTHYVHFTEYVPGPGGGLEGAVVRVGSTETTDGLFGEKTKQFVKYFGPNGEQLGTVSSVIEDGKEKITKVNSYLEGGIDLKEGDVRQLIDPGRSAAGLIPSTWDPKGDGTYGKSGGAGSIPTGSDGGEDAAAGSSSGSGGQKEGSGVAGIDPSGTGTGRPGADPAGDSGPTGDLGGGSDGGDPMPAEGSDPDNGASGDPTGGDDGGDPMPAEGSDPDNGASGDPTGGDDGGDPMPAEGSDPDNGASGDGGGGGDGYGDSGSGSGSGSGDTGSGATVSGDDGAMEAVEYPTGTLGYVWVDDGAGGKDAYDPNTVTPVEYRDPELEIAAGAGAGPIRMTLEGDPVDPLTEEPLTSDTWLGPDHGTQEYRDPELDLAAGGGGPIRMTLEGDPVDPLTEEPITTGTWLGPDTGTQEHVVNEAAHEGATASIDAGGVDAAGVEAAIGQAVDPGALAEHGAGVGADAPDAGEGVGFGGQDLDGDGLPG